MVYLKIEYKDVLNKNWKLEIFDEDYTGEPINVFGHVEIVRPKTEVMEVIKAMSLNIRLLAYLGTDYYTRFIEKVGDKQFPVTLTKNTVVQFKGFLDVDGITEDFVTDKWHLNLKAIDGLGYLENTKFLNSNNQPYIGMMRERDILLRCLVLTGQDMGLKMFQMNLSFGTDIDLPLLLNAPINGSFVNTERFTQRDNSETVFDARQVLEGVLRKYGCVIYQLDGYWNVIRVRDYYNNVSRIIYDAYSIDGTFEFQYGSYNKASVLGSQINGFDPFHATGNQRKEYNSSLGAYKATYKYGFVSSIIKNNRLIANPIPPITVGSIPNWELKNPNDKVQILTTSEGGKVILKTKPYYDNVTFDSQLEEKIIYNDSQSSSVESGRPLTISVTGDVRVSYLTILSVISISLVSGSTTYFLDSNGNWSTNYKNIVTSRITASFRNTPNKKSFKVDITTADVPEDGNIKIILYVPFSQNPDNNNPSFGELHYDKIVVNGDAQVGITGESWTATKTNNKAAVVDAEDKIYSADNDSDVYVGAIKDSNGENSVFWRRSFPSGDLDTHKEKLLYWLAFNRLEMSFGNSLIFKGDIYGEFEYGRKLTIDNVEGVFMTTAYKKDTHSGLISAEHVRIFNDIMNPQDEIYVTMDLEGENIVKPTIE